MFQHGQRNRLVKGEDVQYYTLTCMCTNLLHSTSSSLFISLHLSSCSLRDLVTSYKLSLLENVDPNPDNFVSADIISTHSVLMGCLLQLEINLQTKVGAMY